MKTELESKQLTYQFDTFRLDTSAFRLLNGDSPVTIEPKALQLLVYLLENRGRLLEKQQILDAVWGELSVTENALTREIAILRRALGDDTRQPRFIETVPTRGYRFIAQVRETPLEAGDRTQSTPKPTELPQHRRKFARSVLIPIAASVVIILIGHSLRTYLDKTAVFFPRSNFKLAQVTFSSGLDVFPNFSPDGNSIAYSSDASGNLEVYVRPLSSQSKELQITSDGQANVEPAYSPDGQWIAYHSRSRNGIWIIPALGGTARRVTEFGSHPAWSHDGSRIAFESGDIGAIIETESGSSPDSSIWTVNVGDGSLHQITRPSKIAGPAMFGHSTPQWTPDDRRILFAASWQLWTVASDGSDLQPVARDLFGYDPVFSPNADKIWFVGGGAADSGIWEVAVDGSGRATGAPRLLHSVPPGNGHFLAASASGNRIAFVQMNTRDNLYSIDVGSGTNASPMPITRDTRLRKTNPGFSPNGKWVSFGVAQVGQPNQIWIADMTGKSAQQIPVARSANNPNWLSNDELSYWIFVKGSAQLWKWNIPEGRASLMFDSGQDSLECVRMSPDGQTGAFQRNAPVNMNIWSLSIQDKSVHQLTFSQTPIGWPSWSHDGKMLALEMKTGADTNIGVMPSGGGPISVITHDTGQNWPYSWSPEDDKIAFAAFRHGRWNVFSVSRKTGVETQLTNYTAPSTFVRYPEWSPTGAQIVYEYGETTGNIWMLESR